MKDEINSLKSNIAAKLRGLRAEKGITQTVLAEKTGLDIATITRYENGVITQSLDKLLILALFYNVDIVYFFK